MGMNTYLYRLHFSGTIHFGGTGIGLEETTEQLPSDSLVSALINASVVAGTVEEFLTALREDKPAIQFSSLFPFGPKPDKRSQTAYVVPRPFVMPPVADPSILSAFGKNLKRLKYLQPDDAWRWLAGPPFQEVDLKMLLQRNRSLGKAWNPDEKAGWWAEELRPRVALDRSSQNSSIWWCASIRFAPEAGLYGLVRVDDPHRLSDLQGVFKVLGEMGLGGERTYGMGSFEFSGFEPLGGAWLLGKGKANSRCLLLSRYYPAADERPRLARVLEAWDFVETRGYVVSGRYASTLKRKRVRMIREGSVASESLVGQYADVTPEAGPALGLQHPVYRCGLGFWMSPGGGA